MKMNNALARHKIGFIGWRDLKLLVRMISSNVRQVLECAGPAALWIQVTDTFNPNPSSARYTRTATRAVDHACITCPPSMLIVCPVIFRA